jgi:hypothetical protein
VRRVNSRAINQSVLPGTNREEPRKPPNGALMRRNPPQPLRLIIYIMFTHSVGGSADGRVDGGQKLVSFQEFPRVRLA